MPDGISKTELQEQYVRVGINIGGTFTDISVLRDDGALLVSKISSTPRQPARAVIDGLAELLATHEIPPSSVAEVVHGTTVGSNTILEKKGARTGLLTTLGFRDVLEIGRIRTPEMFDLNWDKPEPLIPRRFRLEVDERIGADGTVVRPLDVSGVRNAAMRFRESGITSVAVCFINSYRNPAHEREAAAILAEICPNMNVTASCDVLPEMKEYERTSTTVVNAYIQPTMRRYIQELERGLTEIGVSAPLLVVASNGGVMGADAIAERPVFAVGSGPAAGVVGTARLGRAVNEGDLVVFDMGGTTAKASVVEAGELMLTSEYEFREGISTPSRFIKAGGYMLKVPAVDIAEVGSGGGSIAWIDTGGLLKVGPESAGAEPGPACYGLGGDRPTVTDANVVLGYINPHTLVGGSLKLDKAKAEAAIARYVAEPLGLSVLEAAWGIRTVVNVNMARAIRAITIERGRDPRRFALVAFGGNGAVHAVDLARTLEIGRVLVPVLPGVFTAVGLLASDVEHHFVRSAPMRLDKADFNTLSKLMDEMKAEGLARLHVDGYHGDGVKLQFLADLRFLGQGSELPIPFSGTAIEPENVPGLREDFIEEYSRTYGHTADDPLELANLRLIATGFRPDRLAFDKLGDIEVGTTIARSRRATYLGRDTGLHEVDVVDRMNVRGKGLDGPAIIESYDSTIWVPCGARASCDNIGNILIEVS